MDELLQKLQGGDRRSIGRVSQVVAQVLDDPSQFDTVFNGMLSDHPVPRMRSADAAEKVAAVHPEYLQPHKTRLLEQVAEIQQQEVRWHVAQMLPRLKLSCAEHTRAVHILTEYLRDQSNIVKTFSMQALVDLAGGDRSLRPK